MSGPVGSEAIRTRFGLEPFLAQWLDEMEFPAVPFCREYYGTSPAVERDRDILEDSLVQDLRLIEAALLGKPFPDLPEFMGRIRLKGTNWPGDPVQWWPPGVYLHGLRRLVEGDAPQTIYEDLRRVEVELTEPAPYLERLRARIGRSLESTAPAPPSAPRPEEPAEAGGSDSEPFPAWGSREAWLLLGDSAKGEGFLANGGRRTGKLPPQVFRFLFHLKGKRKEIGLDDAIECALIRSKGRGNARGAFKTLIQRACDAFYALGAIPDARPLQLDEDVCRSLVEIVYRRNLRSSRERSYDS